MKFQVRDETACDKYFLCVNGVETPKSCDEGDYFNTITADCAKIVNGECAFDPCISSSDTAPYVPDPAVDDCTQYLVCNAQITVESKNCSTNLFFDLDQQRCSSKFICVTSLLFL